MPTDEEIYEGDIVVRNLSEDQSLHHGHLANFSLLWPQGVVEYRFYRTFPRDHRTSVMEAMAYITRKSPCVTFVPALPESENYVMIGSGGPRCSSELGMRGGKQRIWLNSGCFDEGLTKPVHELMHTLGTEVLQNTSLGPSPWFN